MVQIASPVRPTYSGSFRTTRWLTCLIVVAAPCCLGVLSQAADSTTSQRQATRSILSNRCFACHGPDEAQRKGGFRLDETESLRGPADSGKFPVVAGSLSQSEILRRIRSTDIEERMPPPEFGKPLEPNEIATIEKWIADGAEPLEHWSFVAPVRPSLPEFERDKVLEQSRVSQAATKRFNASDWMGHPVDRFVLDAQSKRGLAPSAVASREVLIRRISLDLTGLPPTLEMIDAFVEDKRPDAFERLVDRLLASPAYGEHWARKWLDLARYADSAGYADDPPRTIWGYRDWVIRAINDNMNLEEFTLTQLAGDLLPNPTEDQLIATAFHRNTLTNNEGGTNDEEFRNVAVVDRVNTTMAVWMGITFNCAQCHSHKYDPYTQAEYFQVFDVFNQSQDADKRDESPLVEIYTEEQRKKQVELRQRIDSLRDSLETITPELRSELARFETDWKDVQWQPLLPQKFSSTNLITASWDDQGTVSVKSADNSTQKDSFSIDLAVEDIANLPTIESLAIQVPANALANSQAEVNLSKVRAYLRSSMPDAREAKYVRVDLPGKNKFLSLAEVQVFVGSENVALLGNATQSSTDFGGEAKRAIDGNTSGVYEENSVTHTASSNAPWWELDLGKEQKVERIVLWNRIGPELRPRLNGAKLSLLDKDRKTLASFELPEAPATSREFPIDGSRQLRFLSAYAVDQEPNDTASLVTDEKGNGWKVEAGSQQVQLLTLVLAEPWQAKRGDVLRIEWDHAESGNQSNLTKFRVVGTTSMAPKQFLSFDRQARRILNLPPANRSAEQTAALELTFAKLVAPSRNELRTQLTKSEKELDGIKPMTSVPIMRDLAADKKRTTFVQLRGNYKSLGAQVQSGVPSVFQTQATRALRATENAESPRLSRLDFARWLMDKQNPLTARVFANRYWEALFGVGIVRTSEEFGSQGDLPSHPELLDWLATELVDMQWDSKRFLRLLMLSQTYQQTSEVSASDLEADGDNIWLARGPRVRLSAESVRDQALATAGLLSRKMYGMPVRPPQPSMGLTAAFGSKTDWDTSAGEDRYRRGLYTTWRRSNPYPSMATFDAPSREVCTLRRDSTNTPLQALVTLNDPGFVEAAQALARRVVLHEAPHASGRDQIKTAFRLVTARVPDDQETSVLLDLLEKAKRKLSDRPDDASKLATEPLGPLPKDSNVIDMAAWTALANVLLNLDEVLMKR